MNAAFLMVALVAGGEPAPAVVSTGHGCTNCGSAPAVHHHAHHADCGCGVPCFEPCCEKPGLFSRMRGMFSRKSSCCEPACEPCCPPPPPCCEPCCPPPCCEKEGLLTRFRKRMMKRDECCEMSCGCEAGCTGCGTAHAAPAHGAPATVHSAPVHGAPAVTTPGVQTIPATPGKAAEPIPAPKEAPKKMPAGEAAAASEAPKAAIDTTPMAIPTAQPKTGLELGSNPF